jgi:hypothetical protein
LLDEAEDDPPEPLGLLMSTEAIVADLENDFNKLNNPQKFDSYVAQYFSMHQSHLLLQKLADVKDKKTHFQLNRYILSAEPQCGKTGAYLCLLLEVSIFLKLPMYKWTKEFEARDKYRHICFVDKGVAMAKLSAKDYEYEINEATLLSYYKGYDRNMKAWERDHFHFLEETISGLESIPYVVGDMGCGTNHFKLVEILDRFSRSLVESNSINGQIQLHSFDIYDSIVKFGMQAFEVAQSKVDANILLVQGIDFAVGFLLKI